jgi:phosphatidate cytidylyltransferase
MLKQRLLTAAMLIPLIILAILWLPSLGFLAVLVLAAMLAGWEWLTMTGISVRFGRIALLVLLIVVALASLPFISSDKWLPMILGYWLLVSLLVIGFAHRPLPIMLDRALQNQLISYLLAVITLSGFIYTALWLHGLATIGPQMVLYLLVVVWLMDTGGYIFGKCFGKHKLATAISPNKTWEGLAGGILLVMVACAVSVVMGLQAGVSNGFWFVLTLLTALVSVVGDLFESLFKRSFRIKDSGQLLPGHGGMLDRIDSLLAASPVFAAGLYLAGVR